MSMVKHKLIVILGPTSSGKTRFAVQLATKLNAEIISADSRQVYRGMDVGTGKDLAEYSAKFKVKSSKLKVTQIKYHLIDVVNPNQEFNLAMYKKLAEKAIEDVHRRGKLPILVGGSGLYLQAVVNNYQLSHAGADESLRKKLEKKTVEALYQELVLLNKKFAEKINNSDRHNKRRLIRYLEIQQQGSARMNKEAEKYNSLIIGLTRSKKELDERIKARLLERLEKEDLAGEVRRLHREGVSWQRLESFGLEYKFVSRFLQKKITYEEMVERLNRAIKRYAQKQLTWFRRWEKQGKVIHWVKKQTAVEKLIKDFI